MQLRDFQYVIAIAECGSFTKAANRLYITQSALSQGIQRLEMELGVKLFNREIQPITFTREGELFLQESYAIMKLCNDIPKKIAELQKSDVVRVGICLYYCRYYLSNLMADFQEKYPDIGLHIVEDRSIVLEKMVERQELDIAILPAPLQSSNLAYEKIMDTSVFSGDTLLAVPNKHPLSSIDDSNGVDLSLFSHEKFVLLKEGQRLRLIADELCRQAGFIPEIAFETQSTEAIGGYVAAGMGVGFVPGDIYQISRHNQKVTYLHIKDSKNTYEPVIVHLKGKHLSASANTFIKYIKSNK